MGANPDSANLIFISSCGRIEDPALAGAAALITFTAFNCAHPPKNSFIKERLTFFFNMLLHGKRSKMYFVGCISVRREFESRPFCSGV